MTDTDTTHYPNRITLRIDEDTDKALRRTARKRRKKTSEIGREALVQYLREIGEINDAERIEPRDEPKKKGGRSK